MKSRAHRKWPTVPAVNNPTLATNCALLQLESGVESKRSGGDVHTQNEEILEWTCQLKKYQKKTKNKTKKKTAGVLTQGSQD